MKSIKVILKSILLTVSITLLTLIPTQQTNNTAQASIEQTAIVTNVTDTTITIQADNNKQYSFLNEEGSDGWQLNDKVIFTTNNNEVLTVNPYITPEQIRANKHLGTNGTTYTNNLTTDYDLKIYSTRWLKDNYNLTLDIPIEFNVIYNPDANFTVYGFITTSADNKPLKIVIDSNLVNSNNTLQIEKTLIHELTHLALATQGKDFRDKTSTFETEVIKNGSISNDGTMGYLHSHTTINQAL